MLAADCAVARAFASPNSRESTRAPLEALLPEGMGRCNPVDVRGDAPPARFADAVSTVLSDSNVDAVVALHVPRPIIGAVEAAQAVASAARDARKPVLGAWLGAIDRPAVKEALDAGRVANFYTPRTRSTRSPSWPPIGATRNGCSKFRRPAAGSVAARLARGGGSSQGARDRSCCPTRRRNCCRVRIESAPTHVVKTLPRRRRGARVGYPVTLTLETADAPIERPASRMAVQSSALARDCRAGARACARRGAACGACERGGRMRDHDRNRRRVRTGRVRRSEHARSSRRPQARATMLPPLNARLATDLLRAAGVARTTMVALVLKVSAIACMLPWVRTLALDPCRARRRLRANCSSAHCRRPRARAHTGLSPTWRSIRIRSSSRERSRCATATSSRCVPCGPKDAEIERAFVAGLSEETRYNRFFYRLHELTPAMIGRFTQVDYDRELALLALTDDAQSPGGHAIAGIARYIANPDHATAEFAIVVADEWQGRGVASQLMQALIACAKRKGLRSLHGVVLRSNQNMLHFVQRLGFVVRGGRRRSGAGRCLARPGAAGLEETR
jgi:acetyltransferase